MKYSQRIIIGLLFANLSLLRAAPVQAEVTLTPTNLTVVGTRCLMFNFGCTRVTRNLLLNTDQVLTNLQVQSLDLNRADGITVMPATAIRPMSSASSLQPNQFVSVPLQFDFSQARSGEYSGVLLFIYSDSALNFPVTVRIKDHWFWSFLVLLFGIALGTGVSSYRAEGMTRDEILVQVGRLRTQMRSDSELATSFQTKITAHLIDVETALENKRWEASQQAVIEAQAVWDKWRKGREDWLAQLKYQSMLVQRLENEDLNPDALYLQEVRSQLEDIVRETADKESPQQLRQVLQDLQQQINRYLQGQAKLEQLNQLIAQLPPEKQQLRKFELQSFEQGLDSLSPTDRDALNRWQQEVVTVINELLPTVEQQAITKEVNIRSLVTARGFASTTANLLAPVPSARPLPADEPVKTARNRLRWFNWISYASALGLLAGAGFTQLYAAQPTFGANGWSDYFTILAWGFGAEATRDAVTKVVRDWKIPGLG